MAASAPSSTVRNVIVKSSTMVYGCAPEDPVWFAEDTPEALIARIRPDILVKGGDYDMSVLPETRLVESWGGRAQALPFVSGYSTTGLVKKIRASAS